jgi:hypothetical protein
MQINRLTIKTAQTPRAKITAGIAATAAFEEFQFAIFLPLFPDLPETFQAEVAGCRRKRKRRKHRFCRLLGQKRLLSC